MHIDLNALTHSFKNVLSPNNNNNNNNNYNNNNNNKKKFSCTAQI